MVSLEDIPSIPEDADALRVEVQWSPNQGENILTHMFYMLKDSVLPLASRIVLYGSIEDNGYHNQKVFNLEDISKIQPLTYSK